MKFSIIIPTYNEEQDIVATLDAVVALHYLNKEVLVVDDSTDATPDIVMRYASYGVRLIRPEQRYGRCEARNRGIREAVGDIVVILNADVLLPPNFLQKLQAYYEQDIDYVLVKSRVLNTNDLFARYIDAIAEIAHEGDTSWMEWTEGFSCRRAVALAVGLFPAHFPVPLCAGEDGYFGTQLRSIGAKKIFDVSIVVTHVAPARLRDYWAIRVGRGMGSAQVRLFLQKWSFTRTILWACLRIGKNIAMTITIIPVLWICVRATQYSVKGKKDWLPFCWAWFLEQLAFHVGEWRSLYQIKKMGT